MARSAYHFFLANAGYSYDATCETPMVGRIRCARALASAELHARNMGCAFEWLVDEEVDSRDFSDELPPWRLWICIAHTANGPVFASLCGIDFGRDKTPWDSPYRRVVEAELACELPIDEGSTL